MDDPYDLPTGCTRFYHPLDNPGYCQLQCEVNQNCWGYTDFQNRYSDKTWAGFCIMCSREVLGDNRVASEDSVTSGNRVSCGEVGECKNRGFFFNKEMTFIVGDR